MIILHKFRDDQLLEKGGYGGGGGVGRMNEKKMITVKRLMIDWLIVTNENDVDDDDGCNYFDTISLVLSFFLII